jgi:hypothetical protein
VGLFNLNQELMEIEIIKFTEMFSTSIGTERLSTSQIMRAFNDTLLKYLIEREETGTLTIKVPQQETVPIPLKAQRVWWRSSNKNILVCNMNSLHIYNAIKKLKRGEYGYSANAQNEWIAIMENELLYRERDE